MAKGMWVADSSNNQQRILGIWVADTSNNPKRVISGWVADSDNNPQQFWPATGGEPDPPPPGKHVLQPISSYLPMDGNVAWAVFDTSYFQGYISEVKARISWTSLGSANTNVNGRPSGTYYRKIDASLEWANRTIDHDISQGVSEFNAGSANGYTLTLLDVTQPGLFINAMALALVIP